MNLDLYPTQDFICHGCSKVIPKSFKVRLAIVQGKKNVLVCGLMPQEGKRKRLEKSAEHKSAGILRRPFWIWLQKRLPESGITKKLLDASVHTFEGPWCRTCEIEIFQKLGIPCT